MKKFLIPFTIGAAVALAVEYFKKGETPAPIETEKPAMHTATPTLQPQKNSH